MLVFQVIQIIMHMLTEESFNNIKKMLSSDDDEIRKLGASIIENDDIYKETWGDYTISWIPVGSCKGSLVKFLPVLKTDTSQYELFTPRMSFPNYVEYHHAATVINCFYETCKNSTSNQSN